MAFKTFETLWTPTLTGNKCLKLKQKLRTYLYFLHYTTITDGLELCRLLWCLVSALWTLILTAPILLLRKKCNVKCLQICSDEGSNSSRFWLAWGRVHFQILFVLFWVNHSFKDPMNGLLKAGYRLACHRFKNTFVSSCYCPICLVYMCYKIQR